MEHATSTCVSVPENISLTLTEKPMQEYSQQLYAYWPQCGDNPNISQQSSDHTNVAASTQHSHTTIANQPFTW